MTHEKQNMLPLSRRAVRRQGPLHLPRVRHAETLLLVLARRRRRVGHSALCENIAEVFNVLPMCDRS